MQKLITHSTGVDEILNLFGVDEILNLFGLDDWALFDARFKCNECS